jgi:two-component sensor histidine kinase
VRASRCDDGPRQSATSRLVLAPHPAAVGRARAFVRSCCQVDGIDADTCDSAVLLASETVTNAFLHGRSEARVDVTVAGSSVLVEVGDDNSRPPHEAPQDLSALDGRGLMIVDVLAQAWGVRETDLGKVVWFRLEAGR